MVTIDLITGFLGSGKTSFLKAYARYFMNKGMRVGILENDFGAINVDMLMLNELRGDQCELEMIAGGCDAQSHRRRFRTKLISMSMSGYDRVLVEPSGIFDVDEFFDVLRDEPLDQLAQSGYCTGSYRKMDLGEYKGFDSLYFMKEHFTKKDLEESLQKEKITRDVSSVTRSVPNVSECQG